MKHRHSSDQVCPGVNTNTYNYTELCDFLKLSAVSVSIEEMTEKINYE